MAAGRFTVECGERARTVDVSSTGEVRVEGASQPVSIAAIGSDEYEIETGGRRTRAFVAGSGDIREVFIEGRVWRFEVTSANDRRRAAAGGHGGQPTAPMPGTIVKLLVAVGEPVERGQILLKLEAMKMELPIRASHAGRVSAVHCREGELVQGGARLLDIEAGDHAVHGAGRKAEGGGDP